MELILIHLTDIHIKTEQDSNILMERAELIRRAIIKHITTDAEDTILAICVTGDITYSASVEQYFWAYEFFDSIINGIKERYDRLNIQLVFVPGNHDCDFSDIGNNKIRSLVLGSNDCDASDDTIIKTGTSIQANFFEFVEYFNTDVDVFTVKKDSVFTCNEYKLDKLDITIKFHCINTAWCSKLHEEAKSMKIFIPELGDKKQNELVITMMHHDESWFDWNSNERWKEYYKNYSDIVLLGHDHSEDVSIRNNFSSSTNYFIKGNQLFDSTEPSKSGFSLLKINLKDHIERFTSYTYNGELYAGNESESREFVLNRYLKNSDELSYGMLDYLNDIGLDIACKYKKTLKLPDVFAFPLLKGEQLYSKKNITIYKTLEEFVEYIKIKKNVLISGEKENGKSALIRVLFQEFYNLKYYPVLIDIGRINTGDGDILNKIIADMYEEQYSNLDRERIMQMDSQKKICFVDDYNEFNVADKTIKKFFKYLIDKFDMVVIANNIKREMMDFFKNVESREFIDSNFTKASIQRLGDYTTDKIIEKWLLLEDEDRDVKSTSFDVMKKNKLTQVKTVMKTGFFCKTPVDLLLVLSYLENSDKMSNDYSRYSFVYESLILDKITTMSAGDTNKASMYTTILQQIAYKMYTANMDTTVDEKFISVVIFDYKEEYRGNKDTSSDILSKLVDNKIIENKNGQFKFKQNYMYYYFTGSYINKQLTRPDQEVMYEKIFSDLSKEINFSLALFLASDLNIEFDILPRIKSQSLSLLKNYESFLYNDHHELLKRLETEIEKRVDKRIYSIPDNKQIPTIQENKNLWHDTVNLEDNEMNDDEMLQEEMDEITIEYSKTIRIIEFLGDILKNYSSSIKTAPRIEIIDIMYKSSLKLMGAIYDMLNEVLDLIIDIVKEKAEENEEEMVIQRVFKSKVVDLLLLIWESYVDVCFKNLVTSLHSDRITEDIDDYREELRCHFLNMVRVGHLIDTQNGKLPIKQIKECFEGKNQLDHFSKGILRKRIASYLQLHQYDSRDKQQVCDILGFKLDQMIIEEKKKKHQLSVR